MTTKLAKIEAKIESLRAAAEGLVAPLDETLTLGHTRYTVEAIEAIERRDSTQGLTTDEIVGGLHLCGLHDIDPADLGAEQIAEAMVEAAAAKALARIGQSNSGTPVYRLNRLVARFASREDAEDYAAISDRVYGEGEHSL